MLQNQQIPVAGVDLFDYRQTQNMWRTTAQWRRESPIVRLKTGQIYLSRWADCWTVLRDPETFANGNGFKAVEMPDEERMLGEMDPPRHPEIRRVMRQSFDKKSVEAERPFARAEAEGLLAGLPREGPVDLIARFTDQISNLVSFHLLGFPLEDCEQIVTWVRELLHSEWPEKNRTDRGQGLAGAFPEFSAYLDRLVDARRGLSEPEDLVGRLVNSRLGGEILPATVLRALTAHVVLGGISTTTNLLGSLLLRILQDDALHARLRSDPELIPSAVEESLRLDPPVLFLMRVCQRATEVSGVALEKGQSVLVGIASANRDEAVFESPDAFRLDRGLPRHISFSGGAHHCIGAGLARVVAEEAVGAFVGSLSSSDVQLAPDFRYEGVPVFLEYGPERLDVEIAQRRT